MIGQLLIVAGAGLGLLGWRQIYRADDRLVNTGLYRLIRHPQYTGFFLFLACSVINWPAMITVLVAVYYRLAKAEEADSLAHFGDNYRRYQAATGMFLQKVRG